MEGENEEREEENKKMEREKGVKERKERKKEKDIENGRRGKADKYKADNIERKKINADQKSSNLNQKNMTDCKKLLHEPKFGRHLRNIVFSSIESEEDFKEWQKNYIPDDFSARDKALWKLQLKEMEECVRMLERQAKTEKERRKREKEHKKETRRKRRAFHGTDTENS